MIRTVFRKSGRERREKRDTKVCVLGLGNIGLPVSKHISRFYPTTGYDVRQEAVDRASADGISAFPDLVNDDIYVVAVGTWFRNGSPDMSAVDECCRLIADKNSNALVCFESTLSVGTSRKMARKHGLKSVAVCPHRWWKDDQLNHGVVQPRVIGYLNDQSRRSASEFYATLKIPVHEVSSLEVAEMTKIVENSDRYLQIAFAEELKRIADSNGVSFEEIREACNTKWNVDILKAEKGIGGECLPKDIQYLLALCREEAPLLAGAIEADARYIKSLVSRYRNDEESRVPLACVS